MELNLIHEAGRWPESLPPFDEIAALVFRELHLPHEAKSLSVVLSDDAHIRDLSHTFRGKDKPTNVLSFPSDEPDEFGDILFALETISHEAQQQGKMWQHHLTHLYVHGILHLLGYDHETEAQAEEMEAIEIALLAKLSIENPYIYASVAPSLGEE